MKNLVVNGCLNYIKKYNKYSDEQIAIMRYGLEGIYLTLSKTIVILLLSLILGYIFQTLIFFLIYGLLRTFSYGLHAKKSWMCWISSIIIFIAIPIIAYNFELSIYIKITVGIIGTLLMLKNSPADTFKRPIISRNKRLKLKIISTTISLSYLIISLYVNNQFISNCLIYSVLLQNILISPLTYKLFGLPYNNYISYLKEHPEMNNL